MRFVAYALAILTLAACGSSSTAARQSPPVGTSPGASAPPAGSPQASPSPSPAASPAPTTGGYAVLVTTGTAQTYTVSLVGVDGSVAASATPSTPASVNCGDGTPADLPPPVSTSDTRVYFLDASGNVRFLTPNGETGVEYRLPAAANSRAVFAVSPDDSVMAVAVITFTASGATTSLYVDQLQQGGTHKLIFSESGAYTLWPVGWHAGGLLLAKVSSCAGDGPLPSGSIELHLVNPASAARIATLGGPGCAVELPPTPAGAICENSTFTKANILDWSGATKQSLTVQGPTPAYLSPDGSEVALVVNNQTTFAGAKQTLDLVACGWIDSTHVIAGGDTNSQPTVGDVVSGNIVPVAAQGACGGRIPGGL